MAELEAKPFVLIGVNSDAVADARAAVANNDLGWRSFQNTPEGATAAISDAWAIEGWPTLIVIDPEMTIRYRGHDAREATAEIHRLLGMHGRAK